MVAISASVSPRSFLNTPLGASANHGGISRDRTFDAMARAHGRVSAYDSSGIGASGVPKLEAADR